jgi:hypothetical protein
MKGLNTTIQWVTKEEPSGANSNLRRAAGSQHP